jgi:hypothetical protein
MDTLWDKIKQSLIDSANVAAEKAEYLGKIGRARLDIAETRHAIRDRFADLGGLIYHSLQDQAGEFDPNGNEDVKQLIQTIDGLEDVLSRREETLADLRAESAETEETETA